MEHSFDVEIAKEYGVNCAIILKNIYFWVEHNRANGKHFYDGRYWTYNSVRAYSELFPYMGDKQIRNALKTLEDEELIITGNFNEDTRDRTKWYALSEKAYCICQKGNSDLTERANDNNNINNIDSNTDINTDNKHNSDKEAEKAVEHDFEIIRNLYPKSRLGSRIEALSRYKQWISKKGKDVGGKRYRLTREQVYYAIEKYVNEKESQGKEVEYWKTFETMMGRQLLDYVEFDE